MGKVKDKVGHENGGGVTITWKSRPACDKAWEKNINIFFSCGFILFYKWKEVLKSKLVQEVFYLDK